MDIEKFFDSLDPALLLGLLQQLDFPPLVLCMQVNMHWAVRVLVEDGHCSKMVSVTRSVLAGSEASLSMARGYIYEVCEKISNKMSHIRFGTYVDDMTLAREGTHEMVVGGLTEATEFCVKELRNIKLKCCGKKSLVVGSCKQVADAVVDGLQARGVGATAATSARDLGVDAGGGKRRAVGVMKARLGSAAAKTSRLRIMHKMVKSAARVRTSRLWSGSILPTAMHSATIAGMSRQMLLKVRRLCALAVGGRPCQRCVTTTIAMQFGAMRDPAVQLACDVVFQWIQVLFSDPNKYGGMKRLETAWRKIKDKLTAAGPRRWSYVTGPMGAVIAVLLDLQWDPVAVGKWRNRLEETWELDPSCVLSKVQCAPLLQEIAEDVLADLWKVAAAHRGGASVEGPCTDAAALQRRRWQEKGEWAKAGMLLQVAAGGVWPRQRKFQAQLCEDQWYNLCASQGKHFVQDEFHVCWECDAVHQQPEMAELEDKELRQVALKKGKSDLAFWTRGLALSAQLAVGELPPAVQEIHVVPDEEWLPGTYFTDASGGEHSSSPVLRRVGFAGIALSANFVRPDGMVDGRPRLAIGGVLAGPIQTVNRGELCALIQVLRCIKPDEGAWTTIYTDSAYCVRGADLPKGALLSGINGDLWAEWDAEHNRHGGRVCLIKVPAHCTVQDTRIGVLSFFAYFGNLVADRYAAMVAQEHQVSSNEVKHRSIGEAVHCRVLKHITCAWIVAADMSRRRAAQQTAGAMEEAEVVEPTRLQFRSRRAHAPRVTRISYGKVWMSNGHVLWSPTGKKWQCTLCRVCRKSAAVEKWRDPCCNSTTMPPTAGALPEQEQSIQVEAAEGAPEVHVPIPGGIDDAECTFNLDEMDRQEDPDCELGPWEDEPPPEGEDEQPAVPQPAKAEA